MNSLTELIGKKVSVTLSKNGSGIIHGTISYWGVLKEVSGHLIAIDNTEDDEGRPSGRVIFNTTSATFQKIRLCE